MTKLAGLLICLTILTCRAPAFAQNEAQTLLDMHNAYRARHCAPPLTWSTQIAAEAQRWANRCVTEHDPNNELGENLAWGTVLPARQAVGLWYDEISEYNYKAPGFDNETGHFTQVIWRDSKQIGCGRAMCRGETMWVCRYSPPGNVEDEYRANVLPVCR